MTAKNSVPVFVLLILAVALLAPAHAQTPGIRWDRASYVPGDSGTLSLTFVNNDQSFVVQIKNITIYWPWAGFGPDGKWQSGSNTTLPFTNQFIPAKGGTFVASANFNVPSWFGTVQQNQGTHCGGGQRQYDTSLVGCILVGSNVQTTFDTTDLTIPIATASYTPLSLTSEAIPIATLVILVIATAFLALNWSSLRRLNKK
jgi:hypothetical protein